MRDLLVIFAASMTVAASAVVAADSAAQVNVAFNNPDAFTDVRGTDVTQLKTYVEQRAQRYLRPDTKLAITMLDVDLAGQFEWWRSPNLDKVRIVRDVYPPRITLDFKLTDVSGALLGEGPRKLTDMMFLAKIPEYRSDPLRYEKMLLDEWLSREFARTGS